MKRAIDRAVKLMGGQSALGRACGTNQAVVWYWLNRARRVPAEYVLRIEAATDGQITRHDLRPDLYPRPANGEEAVR